MKVPLSPSSLSWKFMPGIYRNQFPYRNNKHLPLLPKSTQRGSATMAMMAIEESRQSLIEFPHWNPAIRRFLPESPLFTFGNLERELLAKHPAIELANHQNHPAGLVLNDDDSVAKMERYTASNCRMCSRVYPSSRLLSIHLSEAQGGGYFQAKVARGYAMYECFVEGCGMKLRSCESREQHLVECHSFSTSSLDYFFDRAKQAPSKEVEKEILMNELVSAVAKLCTCSCLESSRMRKKNMHEKPGVCESDQRVGKYMKRH